MYANLLCPQAREYRCIGREIHWRWNKRNCLQCPLCIRKLLRLLLRRSVFLVRQICLQIKQSMGARVNTRKSREESNWNIIFKICLSFCCTQIHEIHASTLFLTTLIAIDMDKMLTILGQRKGAERQEGNCQGGQHQKLPANLHGHENVRISRWHTLSISQTARYTKMPHTCSVCKHLCSDYLGFRRSII